MSQRHRFGADLARLCPWRVGGDWYPRAATLLTDRLAELPSRRRAPIPPVQTPHHAVAVSFDEKGERLWEVVANDV